MFLLCLPVIVLAIILVYEGYVEDEEETEYTETVYKMGD